MELRLAGQSSVYPPLSYVACAETVLNDNAVDGDLAREAHQSTADTPVTLTLQYAMTIKLRHVSNQLDRCDVSHMAPLPATRPRNRAQPYIFQRLDGCPADNAGSQQKQALICSNRTTDRPSTLAFG